MISAKYVQIGLGAGVVVLGGVLLFTTTGMPLGTLLFLGLFLVCPLMMLGMHRHGRRNGGNSASPPASSADHHTSVPSRPLGH